MPAYTKIDIPFIAGQDESIDEKILPAGTLRRVENAFQSRTGRMVERHGERNRSRSTSEQQHTGDARFISSLPNDLALMLADVLFPADVRGKGIGLIYNRENVILRPKGTIGGWGYVGHYYAAGPTGTNTWSPSVAVTRDWIIFGYVSGSGQDVGVSFNVDVYDRETLRISRSITFAAAGRCEIKVVAFDNGFSIITRSEEDCAIRYYSTRSAIADIKTFPGALFANSTIDVTQLSNDPTAYLLTWVEQIGLPTSKGIRARVIKHGSPAGLGDLNDQIDISMSLIDVDGEYTVLPGGVGYDEENLYLAVSYKTDELPSLEYIFGYTNKVDDVGQTRYSKDDDDLPYGAPCLAMHPAGKDAVISFGFGTSTNAYLFRNVAAEDPFGPNVIIRRSLPLGSSIIPSGLDKDELGWFPVGEFPRSGSSSDSSDTFADIVGTITLCSTNEGGEPAGTLLSAGGSDFSRSRCNNVWSVDSNLYHWTPAHPVQWLAGVPGQGAAADIGAGAWIVPIEQRIPVGENGTGDQDRPGLFPIWETHASFAVLNHEQSPNNIQGIEWGRDGVLMSGAAFAVMDDKQLFFGGFTGAPRMVPGITGVGGDPSLSGTWLYRCVMEYRDLNGRLWRSAPSASRVSILEDGVFDARTVDGSVCAGYPVGSELVYYRTTVGPGSIFYRVIALSPNIDPVREMSPDSTIVGNPTLYTDGGAAANESPPMARYIARTRDRVWLGHLEYPNRVQASKFIRPDEGITFSNLDNFFVDIPDDVTGLAWIDDTLVVFSYARIFLVGGQGPNDQGVGFFNTPTVLPSDIGCKSANSIVVAGDGVFFQSRRGIELLPRGFSEPLFVGDAVRDITDRYPYCLSSVLIPAQLQIRFLMSTQEYVSRGKPGIPIRVIVYDMRLKTWYSYTHSDLRDTPLALGLAVAERDPRVTDVYPPDGAVLYRTLSGETTRETLRKEVGDRHHDNDKVYYETGQIRPAGLMAGAMGRRFNILGTWMGEHEITVEMAFDDAAEFSTKWVKTWNLTADDYAEGDPVVLELTLPVQKFWAVRFRVTAKRPVTSEEGFRAHGITLFVDTEGEGPRVGSKGKG